jgi:hypothetical protein
MNQPEPYECLVPGCSDPHHARGLCGAHFQEWRRTGEVPMPEYQEHTERERWIHCELCSGVVPEWASKTGSMFDRDEERRAAWDERKDKLMEEEFTGTPTGMGHRPWAWWQYESGRPELRFGPPERFDFSRGLAEVTRLDHEYEVEKFSFLAEHGHLTDAELEKIAAKGREATERIGTGWERKAHQSPDYGGDKLKAARAEAVSAALKA